MQTKDREPHTDNPATENLGTTTQMAEKHEIHSTDLVEQVKKVFVENLRDRGWRPVKELEGLIPDALAEARLATVNQLATAGQADPKEYGRLLLRMDAVKALVDSGVCEVRGAEGKEEIRLVPHDGAAESAARPAATATNSDKSAKKTVTSARQLDGRSRGKDGGVPKGNNESATPNDTTDDDEAAAIAAQANKDNTAAKPTDDKTSGPGVADMPFHPVADLFPLMTDAEYEELKNDIKANGLLVAIWIYEGKIIDGRNRYRACLELGIQPHFQEWDGRGSLVAFVISLNDRRRHLTTSQRVMVAAKAKPMFEEEALQRKLAGKPANLPLILEEGRQGEAATQAGALMRVSPSAVYQGQKVRRDGIPELQRAVETGKINVSTAAALAGLDKEEQADVLKQGLAAVRAKAKEFAQRRKVASDKPVNNAVVQPSGTKAKDDAVKKQDTDKAEDFKRFRQALHELLTAWKRDSGSFVVQARGLKPKKERDHLKSQLDDLADCATELSKALDA